MDYQEFIKTKTIAHQPSGFELVTDIGDGLFDWQCELVRWACRMGKSAIFADCGLGKTVIQLDWAYQVHLQTGRPVLILAPLAVSDQTVREGEKFGYTVNLATSKDDIENWINISNYEKLHKFDTAVFGGVVLDESSILKNFSGKIRNQIIDAFANTPYKLCCTATPSPNDFTELGNHAEFLNVMTRVEMLSMFFINDTANTGTWRLKGHTKDNAFWQWLSSWGVVMRNPNDIGFNGSDYILPKLNIIEHVIQFRGETGTLFVEPASTLSERRDARKESLQERVDATAAMVNASDEQWLIWCNLNAESEALTAAIDGAVQVTGSDKDEHKKQSMIDFADGKIKAMVTKPLIAGFGMNWQNCHNMAFVGLSDSYEQFYQAVRRCWRFGQKHQVDAHVVIGEREGAVAKNIRRKENDMALMFDSMVLHMKKFTPVTQEKIHAEYLPTNEIKLPKFLEVA